MNDSRKPRRPGAILGAVLLVGMLFIGLLGGRAAMAAEPGAPVPLAGMRFGKVLKIYGDVSATAGGVERKLAVGDIVFVGERVRAATTAEAVLKTEDAGMIAIRPNADFVAEAFVAHGKPSDNFAVRIFTGSLRVVTGWIGRLNKANHKILTPTATIGIRGTDHEPYVLSAELAAATASKAGTYDKVNRGGTTLVVGENKLDIGPGQVGFVRAAKTEEPGAPKTRMLMTILLPVLLDKVPAFYVPGRFDDELDRYALTADQESQRELARMGKAGAARDQACNPGKLAKAWLKKIDGAAQKGDAATIIAMFAPDVAVRATVRNTDGSMSTVDLGRDELAQSTVAAIKGLTDYRQRRVSTQAAPADAGGCDRLTVKSVVIEQGRQSGKPYRFESVEDYVLELRDGKWLAVKAETTQR